MKRIEWIDIARGIGMILIIVGHSLYIYTSSDVARVIFAVHVPIFFILSGFLFSQHSWKRTMSGLNKNILLPYVATATVVIALSTLSNHLPNIHGLRGIGGGRESLIASIYGIGTPTNLFGINVPAIGAIWFLLAMYVGDLIFKIIVDLTNRERHQLLIIFSISAVLAIIGFATAKAILLPWSINAALISQLFYWFGFALRKTNIVDRWNFWELLCGLALWGISAVSGFFYLNVGFASQPILSVFGAMGGGFVLIVFSKWLATKVGKLKWLNSFGRNSLIVMCIHVIDLDNIKLGDALYNFAFTHYTAWIGVAIVVIYRIAITSGMVYVMPKIPFIRSLYMNRKFPFQRQKASVK